MVMLSFLLSLWIEPGLSRAALLMTVYTSFCFVWFCPKKGLILGYGEQFALGFVMGCFLVYQIVIDG